MSPSYEFGYAVEEAMSGLASAALFTGFTNLLNIAAYILSSLALYTLAKRRGLSKPWLSWIPVANVWILGSLSDQYRYVVKGEIKSKRKILLTLSILSALILAAACVLLISIAVRIAQIGISGGTQADITQAGLTLAVSMLSLFLPMAGISIAAAVIRFMALYDIYTSMDPSNRTLFLVLSILFNITEPFFLFFNRNKDLGMPPRRQEPAYVPQQPQWQPPQPVQEPWEQAEEPDYL